MIIGFPIRSHYTTMCKTCSGIISDPKNEQNKRLIPLLPAVAHELELHKQRQASEKSIAGHAYVDNDLVFANHVGTPSEPKKLYSKHVQILQEAGLPHVRFHDLRHSVASFLMDSGEDPETIRALLGHSSASSGWDRYCHANEKGKIRAVTKTGKFLKNMRKPRQ